MGIVEHAEREFSLLGVEEEEIKAIKGNVIELLKVFENQGHSEMSARLCVQLFYTLANFGVLTPLTGDDDEWFEVKEGLYQNKRCPTVFKDKDGNAWDINGVVFKDKNGVCYVNEMSVIGIDFPYMPGGVVVEDKNFDC